MAKEVPNKMTPEEEQAEKDRLARIKKEEKELKAKAKEREKLRKEREKRIRGKERKEERRIRRIINFPIKTLLQISTFFTAVAFLIIYFGNELDLEKALYICFLLFILLFFTVGTVMVIGYWKISDERIKDMEIKRKKDKEEETERLRREEEELERLLRSEIDDISDEYSSASKLLDNSKHEDDFGHEDIDLSGFDDDEDNSSTDDNSENSTQEIITDEPAPFFNEDDFMNEVLFGSSGEKQKN